MNKIKPMVQTEILKGWGVDPQVYFGTYDRLVGIEIDPFRDPSWIDREDIYKVAVQVEPPTVNNKCVQNYLLKEGDKFDLILSYYDEILDLPNSELFLSLIHI